MICKYCKMEVPEGYRYCPNCGLLLDLGKQFTVPERKYTIPKYEYQPKKAEAEAAAPETTQQFLQPQPEESTEEAEARLELELQKALERDARALEAAKKPTEAVEFSDEDYARVEQDDSPDAIELEEKQPAEALVESVTLETADEAESVQEQEDAGEAAEPEDKPDIVEVEAVTEPVVGTAASVDLVEAEAVAEEPVAEAATSEETGAAEEQVNIEASVAKDAVEEPTAVENSAETEQKPEAIEENTAAEEAVATVGKEAEPVKVTAETAVDGQNDTSSDELAAAEMTEEVAVPTAEEPKDSEIEEAVTAEETPETEKAQAETDATTTEVEESTAVAEPHSDLEERIAALLPDDGLDSTKVDEQGNPAFVWDENISFMEAVSEKSVGDFAVEEDEKAAEAETAEPAAEEQPVNAELVETEEPVQETEIASELEVVGAAEEPVESTAAAAETAAELDMTAEASEAVPEAIESTEPESTAEAEPETAEETTTESNEEVKTEIPHIVDVSEIEARQEAERSRKKKRFLIPLAVCAVAAGAIVVYLNLPAQRMSRALNKGRNYVESNNFTAAVPVLEKLLQSQPDSLEVQLLLSEAYANTDRHEQAVALLEEAKATYPDNAELLEKLAELNPTVTVSVPSGTYSDSQSIALSNEKGYEIRYQLNDEPEQTYDDEILLSTNGDFTLSAYAVAADGGKGESVSMNYTIQLDPEKYPLDQFVTTTEGTQYIDANGAVQTGWMTKDDRIYYFDEKGYMLTGLQTIDGATYFFDADGVMSTGWQEQDGKHYFFDEKGRMLTNTWIDNQYYVGEDGAMLTNTTTPDGVFVNAAGRKDFDAASEFANYPNSIVEVHTGTKVDKGDYYEVSASVYHQKSDNKPTGESYDIILKVLKHAKVHYLDNNLPDIIASDAFSFLKEIGMQKIQQDNDGYVTEFSFALGEKRS